jgi:hypothetical protein
VRMMGTFVVYLDLVLGTGGDEDMKTSSVIGNTRCTIMSQDTYRNICQSQYWFGEGHNHT